MERVVKQGGLIGVLDSDRCDAVPFIGCARMSLPGLLGRGGLHIVYQRSYPDTLADTSLYVLQKY
jgi:hypothetical protein